MTMQHCSNMYTRINLINSNYLFLFFVPMVTISRFYYLLDAQIIAPQVVLNTLNFENSIISFNLVK